MVIINILVLLVYPNKCKYMRIYVLLLLQQRCVKIRWQKYFKELLNDDSVFYKTRVELMLKCLHDLFIKIWQEETIPINFRE